MKNRYSILPSFLINSAVHLDTLGIKDLAWKKDSINDVLSVLSVYKVSVLGGDVYVLDNGTVSQTLDSWYIKKDTCYLESYRITNAYIENYEERNAGEFVFSIIF